MFFVGALFSQFDADFGRAPYAERSDLFGKLEHLGVEVVVLVADVAGIGRHRGRVGRRVIGSLLRVPRLQPLPEPHAISQHHNHDDQNDAGEGVAELGKRFQGLIVHEIVGGIQKANQRLSASHTGENLQR